MVPRTSHDPRREFWVCGDESGTLTTTGGPEDRYFLIATVGMEGEALRRDFDHLADELRPLVRDSTRGLFHANYDTPLTRDRVFAALGSCELAIDVSVVDKEAVPPELIGRLGYRLYTLLWYHHLIHTLPGLLNPNNKVHLVVAALGEYSRKQAFQDALAQATGTAYMPLLEKALAAVGYTLARDDFHHHLPALRFSTEDARQDRLLQVADYCAWAIHRKLTRDDDRGYGAIQHLIRSERFLSISKKAVYDPAKPQPIGLLSVVRLTGLTHEYTVTTEYRIGPADSFQALLTLQEAIQSGDVARAVTYLDTIRPSDLWHDKDQFQSFLTFVGMLVDMVITDLPLGLRATSALIETARHAVATYGDDPLPRALLSTALYNHGVVLGRLERDDDALRFYEEVLAQPNEDHLPPIDAQKAKALVNTGNILRRRGDGRAAFPLYCRAIDCSATAGADMIFFEEALANAVSALAKIETIDEQRAEEAYTRALAADHPDISPQAANRLGWLLRRQGRLSEAEAAYQHAADSDHSLEASKAILSLGCLRAERSDHAPAEVLLTRATTYPATAAEAEFQLAQVFVRTDRLDAAEGAIRRALATGDQRIAGPAHALLGRLLHEKGESALTEAAYRDALATGDPQVTSVATYFLGVLYHDRGELTEAEAAFETVAHTDHAHSLRRWRTRTTHIWRKRHGRHWITSGVSDSDV